MHDGNTRRKRKKGKEATFKQTVTENFPKLMSDIQPRSRSQKSPSRIHAQYTTPRDIIFKEEKVLKEAKRNKNKKQNKQTNKKSPPFLLGCKDKNDMQLFLRNHSSKKRMEWNIKYLKEKKNTHQPRILYSAKLSFKSEGEIKAFSDKS